MPDSTFIDYEKFVLFGDSITEGAYDQASGFAFAAALQNYYRRRLDVVGRGFSGYNTSHALQVLPSIIPPASHSKIRLMTIFFGANDAVLEGQHQHVPLVEYRHNLGRIVNHPALRDHNPKLLLIIPPAVCEYKMQEHDKEQGKNTIQRLAKVTKQYADAAIEFATEHNIPYVNLWMEFMKYAGWDGSGPLDGSKEIPRNQKLGELLRDGLHFTPKGYEILYHSVVSTIQAHYPEELPEALNYIFPTWDVAPKYQG